jgi:hypothetical protein
LRASYIAEFNQKFTGPAAEQVTAFGRTARRDLNWIFSVQTERVVDKDNTVAIADRHWQLEKTRFRSWLAECTVTIHEHLDELVSIRYGPPVVGRYQADGSPLVATSKPWPDSGGKDGTHRCGSSTAAVPIVLGLKKQRKSRTASRRG